ncbi:GUN4 domain-containing protein [Nostoc sp. KVJ20]|uniref:GUN4 domain-containing protein n=1 Tax=Nostoc sp. KVJ20 TaxID=457944 RepID=UPI000A8E3725|nr:GUN4 domain-containing protein [Nostoc sp. KVJ20]
MPEVSLKLFFSYSHKDETLRDELAKHLSILERQSVISSWCDRRILPGEEWDYQINDNLNTADIILLLISSDFLFSKYCWDVEVKKAIERHHTGEACVIPVILRSVDWSGAPFAKLQALPKNAEPVVSRHWHNQDEAFTDVAKGIRTAAEKLKKERPREQEQANILGQQTSNRILKEKIERRQQKPQSTQTTTAKLTQETDDLSSEKSVDYTRLRDLLKAGNWKEADQETLAVMLKATGREQEGWLNSESINNFPCTDLRTIDQLWVKYSNGHFGFSVQKQIWESVGKDYEKFGDRVGWRKRTFFNKNWLSYSYLTFTTNSPQGHMPAGGGAAWRWGAAGMESAPHQFVCLFWRRDL